MPAGLPIAADGFGNFWVLDLTPDTVEVAPVFFLGHDPPVLLYQAPDLATFLDEVVKKYVPPHASLVDDVREDRLYDVWRSRPGAMTQVAALSSPDLALREFAESLDPAWTIVDLRQREVGMGVAWGALRPAHPAGPARLGTDLRLRAVREAAPHLAPVRPPGPRLAPASPALLKMITEP